MNGDIFDHTASNVSVNGECISINPNRIGKVAVMGALTSRAEEDAFKEMVARIHGLRIGITFVAGLRSEISKSFVKAIVNCALQHNVVRKTASGVHGVIHAGIEASRGFMFDSPAETSVKLKVCVVSDSSWVAVAAYGESAFHPETNHERMGFGMMHI